MLKYRTVFLLGLFTSGFIKTLITSPTLIDASVLLILGLVFSYSEYKNNEKRLSEIESLLKNQAEELSDQKDKMSSIKIVQQVKPNSLTFRA